MDSEGKGRHLGSGGETGESGPAPMALRCALGPCVVTGAASAQEQMHLGCPRESCGCRRAGFPSCCPFRLHGGWALAPPVSSRAACWVPVGTNYLSGPPSAQGSGPRLQPGRQGTSCCLLCLKADRDPLGAEVQPVSAAALPGQCVLGAPEKTLARGRPHSVSDPGTAGCTFRTKLSPLPSR